MSSLSANLCNNFTAACNYFQQGGYVSVGACMLDSKITHYAFTYFFFPVKLNKTCHI